MLIRPAIRWCFLLLCAVVSGSLLHAADVIQADSQTAGQTFIQPLSVFAAHPSGDYFFVGSRTAGAKEWTLAYLQVGAPKFVGFAPESAKVNGIASENPVYNVPILHMALLGENYRPVVVPDGQFKKHLFFIDNFSNEEKVEILATGELITPEGLPTSGILNIAANNRDRGGYVFAAVKNNVGSPFGDAGSGVAVSAAHFVEKGEGAQKISHFLLEQIGVSLFNKTLPIIAINNDVTFLADAVDMHWDNTLSRLYIAIQAKAAAGATDGVKSLVVGKMQNNAFVLQTIAPNAIFDGSNKIVGATGVNEEVSLHKVRAMHTSTFLQYVIVHGGNGDPASTKRYVFALPLVNDPQNTETHGTLANKNALPENSFGSEQPQYLLNRGFKTAATVPSDAVTFADSLAQVGVDGTLLSGDIDDVFVQGDAVFAVVSTADAGNLPGIFSSRALFDRYGRIASWTEWRRVSGSVQDKIFGASLEPISANILYLTGQDATSLYTVKRTGWGHGDNDGLGPLVQVLGETFPRDRGGIYGLFDNPLETPGLDDISLLVATGCQTVAMIQTSVTNGSFVPTVGDAFINNKLAFTNGAVSQTPPASTRVITITGGALDQIGFIKAAEVATGLNKAWLFVGGDGGLAVLVRADGSGWNDPPGLGSGFAGLLQNTAFKIVGSYQHVKKLIYNENFLYVLTESKLDRIDLVNSNFATGSLVSTTIAESGKTPGMGEGATLFDLVVSEKLGLLATSTGLFRISNDYDISTVSGTGNWTQVSVPESWCGPVKQLYAISETGRVQDTASSQGGMVYALVSFAGKNRSQVNRFAIQPVEISDITNDTVKPLPDQFIENIESYFVSFGDFRDWIVSDGAIFFHEINRHLCDKPVVYLLWARARSGMRALADKNSPVPLALHETCFLLPLLRNSATGAWLLAGNDNLRINE